MNGEAAHQEDPGQKVLDGQLRPLAEPVLVQRDGPHLLQVRVEVQEGGVEYGEADAEHYAHDDFHLEGHAQVVADAVHRRGMGWISDWKFCWHGATEGDVRLTADVKEPSGFFTTDVMKNLTIQLRLVFKR